MIATSRITRSVLMVSSALALSTGSAVHAQSRTNVMWTQDPMGATSTTRSSGSPGPNAEAAKDKVFLQHAAEGGLAEVDMGKLAAEQGSAQDVKEFGTKMVIDHQALLEKLKPFADQYGAMAPTKPNKMHAEALAKLQALSGDEFDKEYIVDMIRAHHHDFRAFREEIKTTQDADLKATLQEAVKVIAEHLQMITDLAKAHNVTVPPPPNGHGGMPPPPPPEQ